MAINNTVTLTGNLGSEAKIIENENNTFAGVSEDGGKTFNRMRETHISFCQVAINGYGMLPACGVAAGAAIQFVLGVKLVG